MLDKFKSYKGVITPMSEIAGGFSLAEAIIYEDSKWVIPMVGAGLLAIWMGSGTEKPNLKSLSIHVGIGIAQAIALSVIFH